MEAALVCLLGNSLIYLMGRMMAHIIIMPLHVVSSII